MSTDQYALVRWIEEERIGVMPCCAAGEGVVLYPGQVTIMKWKGKKEYEVEILKVSENSKNLHTLCTQSPKSEISREEIIEESEALVTSSKNTLFKEMTPVQGKITEFKPNTKSLPATKRTINNRQALMLNNLPLPTTSTTPPIPKPRPLKHIITPTVKAKELIRPTPYPRTSSTCSSASSRSSSLGASIVDPIILLSDTDSDELSDSDPPTDVDESMDWCNTTITTIGITSKGTSSIPTHTATPITCQLSQTATERQVLFRKLWKRSIA